VFNVHFVASWSLLISTVSL